MVSFNGIDLEEISSKIKLLDVVINPPEVILTNTNPAIRDGDIFARRQWGPRTVDVIFSVMEDRKESRKQIIDEIVSSAYSTAEKKLLVPQVEDGYLMAVCSAVPAVSAQNYSETLTVSFRAADPHFQSNFEKHANIGDEFQVLKAAGPSWRIEQTVSGLLTYPMWTLGSKQISFASIGAGELVMASKDKSALLDGASVIPSLMLGSRFFQLEKGANTIVGSKGAGGVIYWRERWI